MPGLLDKMMAGLGGAMTPGGNGLLSADEQKAAQRRGLLTMAAQMAAQSGPSAQPTNALGIAGRGMMAGQQAADSMMQQAMKAKYIKEQMAHMQAARRPAPQDQYLPLSSEQKKQLGIPDAAFAQVNLRTGKIEHKNPPREGPLSTTTVNTGNTTTPLDKIGQPIMEAVQTQNEAAVDQLARINRFNDLMQQVETGKFAGTALEMQKALEAIGVDPKAIGFSGDISSAEGLRALGVAFTLDSVQKTKGAVSEREMDLFEKAAPSIDKTSAGNKVILDFNKLVANRQRDRYNHMIEFFSKPGKTPSMSDFIKADAAWLREQEKKGQVQAILDGASGMSAESRAIIDELRAKGEL